MERSLSDLTAQCIRCGFCLEACPTFQLTGNETLSPRGRIYLARSADAGELDWSDDVRDAFDNCLGCRACETACPSGVQYGQILELAREQLETAKPRRAIRLLNDGLANPTLFRTQIALAGLLPGKRLPKPLSRLISGQDPEADTPTLTVPSPWPSLSESDCPPVRGEVTLLEGCVMRVLYADINEATTRLLRRVGFRVTPTSAGCCGALHAHSGYLEKAHALLDTLAEALPEDKPLIVNSAGCGSHLKSSALAARSREATTFLHEHGLREALAKAPGFPQGLTVTYHDACHLAHGQGVRDIPRELIAAIPGVTLVPLAEADMCCGSAGTYNITQPETARQLLDRKWANVERTRASIVATGNPGCHAWIAQAAREHGRTVRVLHTLDLLEAAFSGLRAPNDA